LDAKEKMTAIENMMLWKIVVPKKQKKKKKWTKFFSLCLTN
jgi:hypothetical protein